MEEMVIKLEKVLKAQGTICISLLPNMQVACPEIGLFMKCFRKVPYFDSAN